MGDLFRGLKGKKFILSAICIFAAIFVLYFHVRRYYPFLSDDALISLRYAKRMLMGNGLTWNNGERVEGYSNLLWILLVAGFSWFGVDLINSAQIIGFLCIALVIVAIVRIYPPYTLKDMSAVLLTSLFPALSGSFAIWAIGGLEQPLIACLLAWAAIMSYKMFEEDKPDFKSIFWGGVLFGLLSITRPDGILFVIAACLGISLIRKKDLLAAKIIMKLMLVTLVFYFAQILFRLIFYKQWVPNTALVKLTFSWHYLNLGAAYLGEGLLYLAPVIAIVFTCFVHKALPTKSKNRILFLAVIFVIWSIYIISIGGDIFPGRRHLVPIVTLLALGLAELTYLFRRMTQRSLLISLTLVVIGLSFFSLGQYYDKSNNIAVSERWEWYGMAVGEFLKSSFNKDQPLLAVDSAGCLPYWSELDSIDMLGLNDWYIPRHPPADFGEGYLGHELGDGKYVLSRKPDIIIFNSPFGAADPNFLSGRQMIQEQSFRKNYVLVSFGLEDPFDKERKSRSYIWINKNSSKVGISSSDNKTVVPAYLLNDYDHLDVLVSNGKPFVSLYGTKLIGIKNISLTQNEWSLEAYPPNPLLTIKVLDSQTGKEIISGNGNLNFTLLKSKSISLELTNSHQFATEFEQLIFRPKR